ncbi:MAG: spore germination protein [Oscillospiraceae bacterium]|jgi:spore germination protein KA|nr:spore germination protein [Oscillospiraceae bacterium]
MPKKQNPDEQGEGFTDLTAGMMLTASLDENSQTLKTIFSDDGTLRVREARSKCGERFVIAFCDGMIDNTVINVNIVKALLSEEIPRAGDLQNLLEKSIQVNSFDTASDWTTLADGISYGDTLLLIEDCAEGALLSTKSFATRSISEPEAEKILSGPREGFCESVMINLSMLRRKLRNPDLKIKFRQIGARTKTQVAVCYLGTLVDKNLLAELETRLSKIDVDGVLDSNYIAEHIRENLLSPFADSGMTERPDAVAGKMLEGRIAVFCDGSPAVLTLPCLFAEYFQSPEDYYLNSYYSTPARWLRMAGFMLTVCLPALFISLEAFQVEMLPAAMLINIAAGLSNVPLPAPLEAFLMLFVFDLLRETGARIPSYVGQALSIVGALVIGSAAVEANLVSATITIMVAVTGICGLLIPRLSAPVLVFRYLLLLLASFFGIFGLIMGLTVLLIHILNLKSLGISQLFPGKPLTDGVKDTFLRLPWTKQKTRPESLTNDRVRMKMH